MEFELLIEKNCSETKKKHTFRHERSSGLVLKDPGVTCLEGNITIMAHLKYQSK